jgi:hypothetical protein
MRADLAAPITSRRHHQAVRPRGAVVRWAGLLTQGVPNVPQDPFAPRRGPLGSSPDRDRDIGNAHTLVPGPLARL